MPENLPHQDLSESNTILFLTLSAIFLSEGCIGEGMYCHHIILSYNIKTVMMIKMSEELV